MTEAVNADQFTVDDLEESLAMALKDGNMPAAAKLLRAIAIKAPHDAALILTAFLAGKEYTHMTEPGTDVAARLLDTGVEITITGHGVTTLVLDDQAVEHLIDLLTAITTGRPFTTRQPDPKW